ncbi:MAG: sulfotransferase domain-containing protein, partial [Gemmatimonadetes bacterium]|nr:sulfotransferase domain-containing protein [Gemmatimonadota bacterium]
CSYHKCLTVYFGRVMRSVFRRCLPWSGGYRHFNSDAEEFHARFRDLRVASINNRALDLDRLGSFRITRFLRDPRDLVVSGYLYHRRGAEPWTTSPSPTARDWAFVNGAVPDALRAHGGSFADYLQSVPGEEGLLAELEFRRHHLASMMAWPPHHPDILTLRYEDVIGDEVSAFERIFDWYGCSSIERRLGVWFARRYAVGRRGGDAHVRDPSPGQWRRHFTPRVAAAFESRHPGLVSALGYEPG